MSKTPRAACQTPGRWLITITITRPQDGGGGSQKRLTFLPG
jgi:hypothetical protein